VQVRFTNIRLYQSIQLDGLELDLKPLGQMAYWNTPHIKDFARI
jgi:hypothetical protein